LVNEAVRLLACDGAWSPHASHSGQWHAPRRHWMISQRLRKVRIFTLIHY